MTKLKKMPLTFSPHEWAPMNVAFDRIMSIEGARDLALFRLVGDLRSGRLGSLLVQFSDGKEKVTLLNPSDWEQLRPVRATLFPFDDLGPNVDGYFFVRSVDLCKLYPITATRTTTTAHQSDDTQPPKLRRRKPGPKVKKDWRRRVAGEVDRIMENGKRIPSAAELAQFCENKLGYQPDERAIQKLLRYLLGD